MEQPTYGGWRSPLIDALRQQLAAGEASAMEAFWKRLEAEGTPLVEPAPEGGDEVLLTLVWRQREETRNVVVVPGLYHGWQPHLNQLERLEGTDLWYRTYRVPKDLRTAYYLSPDDPLTSVAHLTPEEEAAYFERRLRAWVPDPLNPRRFQVNQKAPPLSVIELAAAPPQPWLQPRHGVVEGEVHAYGFSSERLGNERTLWIYVPPSGPAPSTEGPRAIIVLLDGGAYLRLGVPTMLDNLIASGRIPPTVCVMVEQLARNTELPCNERFSDFLALELVPWLRDELQWEVAPERTVIAGSSYGGLAAVYTGLRHPACFGRVLSQSGSFWWAPDGTPEHEWLTRQLVHQPLPAVRHYLEVGRLDAGPTPGNGPSVLVSNRHLRDVLQARGQDVTYREFNGAHDYICWRGSLADGLLALLADGAAA